MKIGDLVVYNTEKVPPSVPPSDFDRLGLVVEVSFYQRGEPGTHRVGLPMALVQWNGIARTMKHRQDLLRVLSEAR